MANLVKFAVACVALLACVIYVTEAGKGNACDASSDKCANVGTAKQCCEETAGGPAGCCANIQDCTNNAPNNLAACGEFNFTATDGSAPCSDSLVPCYDKSTMAVCCGQQPID